MAAAVAAAAIVASHASASNLPAAKVDRMRVVPNGGRHTGVSP